MAANELQANQSLLTASVCVSPRNGHQRDGKPGATAGRRRAAQVNAS